MNEREKTFEELVAEFNVAKEKHKTLQTQVYHAKLLEDEAKIKAKDAYKAMNNYWHSRIKDCGQYV